MAAFNHVASRGQDCCPQPCSINFILVSKWVQAVGVSALIIFLLSFRTDQFSKCAVCRNWFMGAVSQNQVLPLSFVCIFLFPSWSQRWLLNTGIVFLPHPSIVKKSEFPSQDPKHRLPVSHRRGVVCSLWTSAETRSMLRDSRLSCDLGVPNPWAEVELHGSMSGELNADVCLRREVGMTWVPHHCNQLAWLRQHYESPPLPS